MDSSGLSSAEIWTVSYYHMNSFKILELKGLNICWNPLVLQRNFQNDMYLKAKMTLKIMKVDI